VVFARSQILVLNLHHRDGLPPAMIAAHKFDRWMDITLVQRSLEG
jgi:L-amino acid N-acyltransferase YncA